MKTVYMKGVCNKKKTIILGMFLVHWLVMYSGITSFKRCIDSRTISPLTEHLRTPTMGLWRYHYIENSKLAGAMLFQTLTSQRGTNLTILWYVRNPVPNSFSLSSDTEAKKCNDQSITDCCPEASWLMIENCLSPICLLVVALYYYYYTIFVNLLLMHDWGLHTCYVNVVVPHHSKAWTARTVMFTFYVLRLLKCTDSCCYRHRQQGAEGRWKGGEGGERRKKTAERARGGKIKAEREGGGGQGDEGENTGRTRRANTRYERERWREG